MKIQKQQWNWKNNRTLQDKRENFSSRKKPYEIINSNTKNASEHQRNRKIKKIVEAAGPEVLFRYKYQEGKSFLARLDEERRNRQVSEQDWATRIIVKDNAGNEIDPRFTIHPERFPLTVLHKVVTKVVVERSLGNVVD